MYKQVKDLNSGQPAQFVQRLSDNAFIPFDPANTDYAKFKRDINDSKDKLQDADGNEMSAADAKAYVATLP